MKPSELDIGAIISINHHNASYYMDEGKSFDEFMTEIYAHINQDDIFVMSQKDYEENVAAGYDDGFVTADQVGKYVFYDGECIVGLNTVSAWSYQARQNLDFDDYVKDESICDILRALNEPEKASSKKLIFININ